MTAAKVGDFLYRLLDSVGEASDAVSVHSQVNMKHAPDLFNLPKSECPAVRIRPPRSRCPISWDGNVSVCTATKFVSFCTCGRNI